MQKLISFLFIDLYKFKKITNKTFTKKYFIDNIYI